MLEYDAVSILENNFDFFVLCSSMLTDGRDQIKQATKLVLELVMIMANKLG
jgi:hypothetical protein